MTIKERWKFANKELSKHFRRYISFNKDLQDEIQDIFDGIKWKFEDSNKPIKNRDRLFRLYQIWKQFGIMTPLFNYEVRRLLAKKNISNLEVLNVMLEATYLTQGKRLYDEQLFTTITDNTYQQGLIEAGNKPMKLSTMFLVGLLALPNKVTGNVWSTYKNAIAKYNASEIQKQVLIDLQKGKELDIKNYQDIFSSQRNRYLNKKKEEFSGALDTEVSYLVNSTLLQAYLDSGVEKVRFIAVIDDVTSKMCESLDNQLFYINKLNRFTRYSNDAKGLVNIVTKGLESGINLPPINDNFHYCRSTITPERRIYERIRRKN